MRKCVCNRFVLALVAAMCGWGAHATSIDLGVSTPATATSPIVAGSKIVYTFTVSNNTAATSAPINGVNITVNMPAVSGSTAGFVSLTVPAGWSFTAPSAGSTAAIIVSNSSVFATGTTTAFTLTAK